jgi:hypothetical protein
MSYNLEWREYLSVSCLFGLFIVDTKQINLYLQDIWKRMVLLCKAAVEVTFLGCNIYSSIDI